MAVDHSDDQTMIEPLKMAVEVVRTETIKPSSPTPDHLKKFRLSIYDQFTPDIYTPIVFFYPGGSDACLSADRTQRLKESLSEALERFYPVAGTVNKEELYVDCDDGGVDFLETKVNGCRLEEVLAHPNEKVLGELLPRGSQGGGPGRLLRVQVNVFECGGMAVGLSCSHLIMDACAMSALVKWWAAVARGDHLERSSSPPLELDVIASRFPAIPVGMTTMSPIEFSYMPACSTRRFVFDGAKIASLRDKATSASGKRPTRVVAVSALIWKCIVNALTSKLGHETRPSIVSQPINLRRRLEPPLSENSLGNMVGSVFVNSGNQNKLVRDIPSLASQFKEGLQDVTRDYVTKIQDSEGAMMKILEVAKQYGMMLGRDDIDFYIFTSWCKYGWYGVNFGWGDPAWVSSVDSGVKNVVMMMDTKDGDGIEAWITLLEPDMPFFETNPDLLEFASQNPTINL